MQGVHAGNAVVRSIAASCGFTELLSGGFLSVGRTPSSFSSPTERAQVKYQLSSGIEKWWLINPLAMAGIAFAYFKPATKFPHAMHVLLSTWASLFHVLMAVGGSLNVWSYLIVFLFLFLAVWTPCCVSDIVFPLLFVNNRTKLDKIT